jgi:hypothetical protein
VNLLYRLFHKTKVYNHPNGYVLHSEYRWFPPQVMTNLCLWDGKEWHQAPIHEWDGNDGFDYLGAWIISVTPQ